MFISSRHNDKRMGFLPQVSVSKALEFAFSFSFRNGAAIIARIALPALARWMIFYFSLYLYLTELIRYLHNPSDRAASLVLGLATAGLLISLFLHSIIVAAVTALAMGLEDGGWKYFHARRREWRLYAANLRLLLVVGIWIAAIGGLQFSANESSSGFNFAIVLYPLTLGGLAFLGIRIWFLTAPASLARTQGKILRRSWELSAGHFWRIAAILVPLLLLGGVVEATGELILRAGAKFPPLPTSGLLIDYALFYRSILPGVLAASSIGYLISIVLLTTARVSIYRQLTDQTNH